MIGLNMLVRLYRIEIRNNMNIKELNEWIKSAKYVTTSEYEENDGNKYVTKIYEKDGQLYSIHYCNNYPTAKWSDDCGYMSERDENGKRLKDEHGQHLFIYEPIPVIKHSYTKTIEVTEYTPIED